MGEPSEKRTQIGGSGAPMPVVRTTGAIAAVRPQLTPPPVTPVPAPLPTQDNPFANPNDAQDQDLDDDRSQDFAAPRPSAERKAVAAPAKASTAPISIAASQTGGARAEARVTGPVASTSGDVLIGQVLAERYKIIKKLGEGGMGAVYLAVHLMLEKKVALKILHGEYARKADLVERFIQEAKSASRIRHENVIDISDFGVTPDGIVFFAMELLTGHDLHVEVIRAKKAGQPIPWERSRKIFLQICSALSAAHSHGIVHRDLKPENIYLVDFLGNKDFVKLLDFGIAKITDDTSDGERKLTKTGMLFGTPEYMSPEQARGESVDHRVDIYAMGCILYQLITGRVPFEADNFMGILSMHLTETLQPLPIDAFDDAGAPAEVAAIIEKALAKNRDERWQNIDDMANAIRALHGEDAVEVGAVAVPLAANRIGAGRTRTEWKGSPQVPLETMVGVELPRQQAKGKSRGPLFAVLAIVAIAVGVAAFALSQRGSSTTTTVAKPAPPPTPALDDGPLPAMVTVVLDTNPSRATVYQQVADGGWSKYGVTPLPITGPGSRQVINFKFELEGYGESVRGVAMTKDDQVVVPLTRRDGAGDVAVDKNAGSASTGSSTNSGKSTGGKTGNNGGNSVATTVRDPGKVETGGKPGDKPGDKIGGKVVDPGQTTKPADKPPVVKDPDDDELKSVDFSKLKSKESGAAPTSTP